ncbi:PLP-dependent lyase/thiolase [Patescibacteria group bacterium]|nr:PLP-dependent lyase/thiolase [Patescibacteria group bacterium]
MSTPLTQTKNLTKHLGLKFPVFFKREDLHPHGSHKGRSIPVMIEKYANEGIKNFAISSSGNAALAAALHIIERNKINSNKINLKIFVGKNIAEEKDTALSLLKNDQITVEQVSNPKQQAFQMEKSGLAKNLRQSTDDTALTGYEDLARELNKQLTNRLGPISAIFIPTSSGTTAQGLYLGFQKLKQNPQIHIIQTTACHPISNIIARSERHMFAFGREQSRQRVVIARSEATKQSQSLSHNINPPQSQVQPNNIPSIASAIVDKVAHRKNAVAETIKNSQGFGWIATDEEITQAMDLVKQTEAIEISPNRALSIAGLIHAINAGWKFNGPIVCLLTGK